MRGESQSHLLQADDSHAYIVKFTDNPQHSRLTANEWFASYLGAALHLPVALPAIVKVTSEFCSANQELTFYKGGETTPYKEGLHFGSRLVGGLLPGRQSFDYLPKELLSQVLNARDFWGALVFDQWTSNLDGRQAVFLPLKGERAFSAVMIDHGHCFGAEEWILGHNPRRGIYRREGTYAPITGLNSFNEWLSLLDTIDASSMWTAFDLMPEVWYEGDRRAAARLVAALDKRRHEVPSLLLDVRNALPDLFPRWVR